MVRALALGAVLVAVGCKSGATSSDDPELQVSSQPAKGSAGGFSANLGAELGMGSATGAGSAVSGSGSGSGSAASASATESASATGSESATGSGSATDDGTAMTGAASTSGAAPVAVSAEVAAIKLTLTPGWERDVGEGGTFSRFVSVPRTGQSALFKFHYGYEDARAPEDRAAYKKFLTESQILRVLNDRQRGTAWLLEGKDATGAQAFRMVVIYGGKRLVCWGSLYKDSSLGDVRDEVVIQARKICESISL